jgi:hypothetical protein
LTLCVRGAGSCLGSPREELAGHNELFELTLLLFKIGERLFPLAFDFNELDVLELHFGLLHDLWRVLWLLSGFLRWAALVCR